MDSDEAVALLTSGPDGVTTWNQLRQSGTQAPLGLHLQFSMNDFDYTPLDLRGIDLGGCSLADSKIDGADLTRAHLYRTDLSRAGLSLCKLVRAHLVEANLNGADLEGARLDRANLAEAVLHEANGRASFSAAHLERADLTGATFRGADFSRANLQDSNLQGARLTGSLLDGADLSGADLRGADLDETSLIGANLSGADLRGATLQDAILQGAYLVNTRLEGANLIGCSVYGISAWDLIIDADTRQRDLNIGRHGESAITVDDLEVAQFMYLLMNNVRLRGVIDTITSKVVLILGRFSETRLPVLNALREALRGNAFDLVPIVFDFDKPASRTTAETIATLAGMARFVIADLTDAKSVLQELRDIVPNSPSLPVQSLLVDSQQEPGMLDFFRRYPWFLEPQLYSDTEDLLARLADVVAPAVKMSSRLRGDDETPPSETDRD